MSGFSGAVKLGDLDDFINPSQSCVVALNGDKLDLGAADLAVPEGGEVLLRKRGDPSAASTPPTPVVRGAPLPSTPGEAVKVSLSDCLACSGCVTSAETVLLEAQSAEAFKRALREASEPDGAFSASVAEGGAARRKIRAVVVTVAPQSRVSLARVAGLSVPEAAQRLTGFFKSIGVARVLDAGAARDISLLETGEEFCARFAEARRDSRDSRDGASETGPNSVDATARHPLPVLSSACPGFVCYAEKTHGPTILKHVSAVKSPQAVMGTLVKSRVAEALGLAPEEIFHASVMPCFDKKLEASRSDFELAPARGDAPAVPTRETDCVLTTGEVAALVADAAEARGETDAASARFADAAARARFGAAALARAPRAALDGWLACAGTRSGVAEGEAAATDAALLCGPAAPSGGGSGGYLDYTFRRAARALFGVSVTGPLPFTTPRARNPDLREVRLDVNGETVLRFAAAYGFRNIQNVVRKCKAGGGTSGGYDFVEIMACPSGCLNGGGQLPPPPAFEPGFRLRADAPVPPTLGIAAAAKRLVDELEELYHTGGIRSSGIDAADRFVARDPASNGDVVSLYRDFVGGDVGSARARALWHTRYHDRSAEAAVAAGGAAAAAAMDG